MRPTGSTTKVVLNSAARLSRSKEMRQIAAVSPLRIDKTSKEIVMKFPSFIHLFLFLALISTPAIAQSDNWELLDARGLQTAW